jgi:hypothetical protein
MNSCFLSHYGFLGYDTVWCDALEEHTASIFMVGESEIGKVADCIGEVGGRRGSQEDGSG